ncbi:hypothetical protein JMJ77_0008295 [Colletotrichum scovillei]|uniref:Uncharacterized protein n=1 Tax=Colletotrichum scovillei TaxID=1209932 RepID=A0A9P7RGQ9_9PEZI|nr:hypothetical protein JMJ77_0008295 [Colletotrichum scovillei]KAG7075325.1 hypothetical protein JMJ76_0011785 [Colletotrichum scovillei]KAG7082309.1 hypothetical protein JMJ78_0004412 [Colletotrichum scovillei]
MTLLMNFGTGSTVFHTISMMCSLPGPSIPSSLSLALQQPLLRHTPRVILATDLGVESSLHSVFGVRRVEALGDVLPVWPVGVAVVLVVHICRRCGGLIGDRCGARPGSTAGAGSGRSGGGVDVAVGGEFAALVGGLGCEGAGGDGTGCFGSSGTDVGAGLNLWVLWWLLRVKILGNNVSLGHKSSSMF